MWVLFCNRNHTHSTPLYRVHTWNSWLIADIKFSIWILFSHPEIGELNIYHEITISYIRLAARHSRECENLVIFRRIFKYLT